MKNVKFGTGFAIFVLFFGVSLLEALQGGNWLKAAFWLAIGVVFFFGDNVRQREQH